MTGDSNQKIKCEFVYSHPNTAMNLPRFNERTTTTNIPLMENIPENRTQCLFTGSHSSSYPMTLNPTTPMPAQFPNNYPYPSTSLTMPSSSSNIAFPFTETLRNQSVYQFPECSGSGNLQSPTPFVFNSPDWNETANSSCNLGTFSSSIPSTSKSPPFMFGCKRKTDSPPLPPMKQHITEERMAEHLSRLHISSQTPSSNENPTIRQRRLVMCEEMQRYQVESIIPAQILDKVNKPCTALVPWTPPPIVLSISKENNNNEEEPDNNQSQQDNMEMDS